MTWHDDFDKMSVPVHTYFTKINGGLNWSSTGERTMKKAGRLLGEFREKLWFSFLLNALILLGLLAVFRPVFETGDDMEIVSLVSQAYGQSDAHAVLPHYALGLLLKTFYGLKQSIPWLSLFTYFGICLSFTAITYVLIRRLSNASSVWIVLVFVLWFSYEGYVKVHVIKTAGILSVAGILLLFYALTRERTAKKAFAAGLVLALVGSMLWPAQFFTEAALMSGIGVLLFLQRPVREGWLERFGRCAGAFVLLLILVLTLQYADRLCYRSSEWQEFRHLDEARMKLYDCGGLPSYKENEAAYNALGIDRAAYRMLRAGNLADTETFSAEVLEQIASLRGQRRFGLQMIKDWLREFFAGIWEVPCFYGFLLICLYWLLWGRHKRAEILTLFYEACVGAAVYLYRYDEGCCFANCVDAGIWLTVSCVVLWTYERGKEYFRARAGTVLAAAAVLLSVYSFRSRWRLYAADAQTEMANNKAILETIHSDSEHIYLTTEKAVSLYKSYGVFDSVPYGIMQNIYPLGGWSAGTPLCRSVPERYGIENPLKDVIGNEKAYLVTTDIDMMLDYFRAHYAPEATAEAVYDFGGCKAYVILE